MIFYFVGIILFLSFLHLCFNYNRRARMIRKIPGPREAFIIGNALKLKRTPVGLMKMARRYANRWRGIFRIWIFPIASIAIYNPEDTEVIMSNIKHSHKGFTYNIIKPWLRDGLLLSNGEKWQERRKILTPSFHFNILRQFFEVMEVNARRLVSAIDQNIGEPIDVVPVLSDFTLNSICETAMGTQLDEDSSGYAKKYKNAIYELGNGFVYRFTRPYMLIDSIFNMTAYGRYQNRFLKIVHNFTENVIKQRIKFIDENGFPRMNEMEEYNNDMYKKKNKTAMLDLLLRARVEGFIDNEGIQEEVDTFMFEGHDTTASGLTFMFMLLANHKDVQEKIVAELKEILGDIKRRIKMEDLSKMKYLDCCIKESLRMYPPVHYISRNINEEISLSNYKVPAGTICHILIYDLHHRKDLFPEPEKFDPDRFLPENSIGRHPYSYVPFSAGPRNCIGQKFATMEMKIAVAEVIREFEMVPVTRPSEIEFVADLVLRNDGPVKVKFIKRQL